MKKTTAVVKAKSNLPANWEAQMKEDALKGRKRVENIGVSQRIKTRGGVLQYQDTPVPGNKLRCVVLCDTFENAFYEGEYDADNPQPPVCYAFGEDDTEMIPHEKAENIQHEDCKSCPNNKWGSAEKGRGKACKNQVRMFLIHADALKKPAGIADSMHVMLNVPPTSLAGWAKHVKDIELLGNKPVYAVITEVGAQPQESGGFKLTFAITGTITDKKVLGEVFAKRKAVMADLEQPYQPMQEQTPKKKATKAAARVAADVINKAKQKAANGNRKRF